MKQFRRIATSLSTCIALSGCYSYATSHYFVSTVDGRGTQTDAEAAVDFSPSTTIYFHVLAKRTEVSCVGGLILPLDFHDSDMKNLSSPIIEIGFKSTNSAISIDFDKIFLNYLGKTYPIDHVELMGASPSIQRIEQVMASKDITWFEARFPVNIDAKKKFTLSIDGLKLVDGVAFPQRNIAFAPHDTITGSHNYGERGC
jgi:hypothetical protein